jgi:hypothetical protein
MTTIPLKKPFAGADGMVTEIELRRPVGSDFFALGAPQTWVRAAGGMALVDNDAAIRAYAERLIVKPDPLLAMAKMDVLDAIAVKDAITDFFQAETPKNSA